MIMRRCQICCQLPISCIILLFLFLSLVAYCLVMTMSTNSVSKLDSFLKIDSNDFKHATSDESILNYLNRLPYEFNNSTFINQLKFVHKTFVQVESKVEPNLYTKLKLISLLGQRNDDTSKVFVNINICDEVRKPNFSWIKDNLSSKLQWNIPLVILSPKPYFNSLEPLNYIPEDFKFEESLEKLTTDGMCVYDVIINPICITISKYDENLQINLIEAIINGLEKSLNVAICNVKDLKFDSYLQNLKSLQKESNRCIDTSIKIDPVKENVEFKKEKLQKNVKLVMEDITNVEGQNHQNDSSTKISSKPTFEQARSNDDFITGSIDDHETPEYKLKYVSHSSLQDYTNLPKMYSKPDALGLEIKLPEITKSSDIDAKIVGKRFLLKAKNLHCYCLNICLPFEVEEDPKVAKFDVSNGLLILEFAVKIAALKHVPNSPTLSNDSGIECENGYRTNSDGDEDNSSISSQEEYCDNIGLTKTANCDKIILANPDKFILSPVTFSQTSKFLHIIIPCANIIKNSIKIEQQNSHSILFKYMTCGSGFAPICFGALISVQPNGIKHEKLLWSLKESLLIIQLEKDNCGFWINVLCGLNEKEFTPSKISEESEILEETTSPSTLLNDLHEIRIQEDDTFVTKKNVNEVEKFEDVHEISQSVKINRSRCTSDCFVTGSWPKGILKGRSRSLSDSNVDSSWIFTSFGEAEDEVLEEDEDEGYNMQSGSESSSTKKSVHFNEFIAKQVFRSDASILGQRAKNQKKAQQKKRSRERKLSEGNSSNQSQSELSDAAATTEDESNAEGEVVTSSNISCLQKRAIKNSKNGKLNKARSHKGKSKKSKKVPYLSNDMMFELDDS